MNTRDKNYNRESQNTGFYQQVQNMNQNQLYSARPPQQSNFFYERPRDTKYEFMEGMSAMQQQQHQNQNINQNINHNHYSPMSSGGNQPVYKPYSLEKTMNYTNNNQVVQNFPNANMNTVMTPQPFGEMQTHGENRGMDYNGSMIHKHIHSAPTRSYDQTPDRPLNTRFIEKQVNIDASNRIMEQSAIMQSDMMQPKNHFLEYMPTNTRVFRTDHQQPEHYR